MHYYCNHCTQPTIIENPYKTTASIRFCPLCGNSFNTSPQSMDSRLIKLESHDIPNIANHAKSLENRLTSLESLVGAMREKIPTKDTLAEHITATIDSYLDQYDFADEINKHLDNAEIKIIV